MFIDGDAVGVTPVALRLENVGANPADQYEKRASCCGGALMFSEPEETQTLVKGLVEAAFDGEVELMVTPRPVCQMNVGNCQGHIYKTSGMKLNIPVVYC